MAKVVSLKGAPIPTAPTKEPNPQAVKLAEELLELVKAGEIIGFVYAGITYVGEPEYGIGGEMNYGLLGIIEAAKVDVMYALGED